MGNKVCCGAPSSNIERERNQEQTRKRLESVESESLEQITRED